MVINTKTQPNGIFTYATKKGCVKIKIKGDINVRISIDLDPPEVEFKETSSNDDAIINNVVDEVIRMEKVETTEERTVETTNIVKYGRKRQLTEDEIKEIIEYIKSGEFKQKEIGELFGVSQAFISSIKNGSSYREITSKLGYNPDDVPKSIYVGRNGGISKDILENIITDIMSENYTQAEIAKKYGTSDAIISAIKCGRVYKKELSELGYTPPKSKNNLTKKQVHEICKMMEEGESNVVIADHYKVTPQCICDIRHKRIHKNISDQYHYDINYNTAIEGENHPRAIFTNDEVRKICELLFIRGMSVNDVADIMGAKPNTIYGIYRGRTYSNIVSDYKK